MSWNFLSKAEGFLDRVLEEQSIKEKGKGSTRDGSARDTPPRTTTPINRWQERLSKAASQFASTEIGSGQSMNEQSIVTEENSSVHGRIEANQPDSSMHDEEGDHPPSTVSELTELQQSSVFPATMPARSPVSAQSQVEHAPTSNVENPEEGGNVAVEHCSVNSNAMNTSFGQNLSTSELLAICVHLKNEIEAAEGRYTLEADLNAERISTLESRLSFFSGEQIEAAVTVSKSRASSALEKQSANKDQQIALLLKEGDLLSKKEIDHLSTIKRLRGRIAELEMLITTSLKAVEKADETSTILKSENKSILEDQRRADLKVKQLEAYEIEVVDLRREKLVHAKNVTELKRQLRDADETIAQNVTIWTQFQAEKARTISLQQQVSVLQKEAQDTASEQANEIVEMNNKLKRVIERNKTAEGEQAEEILRLEHELEESRANLEERASSASEAAQTKLLRQIETLQTQYSLARQNWTRIEESLILRLNRAEKERDDLRTQEEELRGKIRIVMAQKKTGEEEKASVLSKLRGVEAKLRDQNDQILLAERKRRDVELDMEAQSKSWQEEKLALITSIDRQVQEKLVEERTAIVSPTTIQFSEANRTTYAFDGHDVPQTPDRLRPFMSRSSTHSARLPQRKTTSSFGPMMDNGAHLKSPPIVNEDVRWSPGVSLSRPDVTTTSVSTTSAGPNLGLIERLTSNARKLELEIQILREDLIRMTRQRDEARSDCVSMETNRNEIREIQIDMRTLTQQRDKLQGKFAATLELLGEQTEENDQLKEDIVDMRQMLAAISSTKIEMKDALS